MLRGGFLNLCKYSSLKQPFRQLSQAPAQLQVQGACAEIQQHLQQHCQPLSWFVSTAFSARDWQQRQQFHAGACSATPSPHHVVQLNCLKPAPGSSKLRKRWGRGDGGDRGTTCGRGMKGQKSRKGNKPHIMFDGGQKSLKKFPKVWVTPRNPVLFKELSLSRVLRWVKLRLLDPSEVITMKDLRDSGCAPKTIRWGIELVAKGHERPEMPLHLQVSSVSPEALRKVEAAGGSVERVYYTRLGLRALLKPEAFEKKGRLLPQPVKAWPPRENNKYDSVGQLPPVKQLPGGTAAAAVVNM